MYVPVLQDESKDGCLEGCGAETAASSGERLARPFDAQCVQKYR